MLRSARGNNLFRASVLCKVDHSAFTEILITKPQPNPRKLRRGIYFVDFTTIKKHSSAILELPDAAKITSLDTQSHAQQVAELVTKFVKDTDYPKGHDDLRNLLTRFHTITVLQGDPLGSATLVQHHIPLERGTALDYIPVYRIPHSQRQVLDTMVEDMLKEYVFEPSNSPWNFPVSRP